MTDNLLYFTIF